MASGFVGVITCELDDPELQSDDTQFTCTLAAPVFLPDYLRGQVHEGDTVVFDVHHLHVCGDEAAMVFTGTVHLGDGGMVFDGVDIMRFDDAGQISELRAYWDPAAMRALS